MPRRREKKSRFVRPVFHMFCEGEKTEPNYLNDYVSRQWKAINGNGCTGSPANGQVKVRDVLCVEDLEENTPIALVNAAISKKRRCPEGDIFWVVYDREAVNKYKEADHARARSLAAAKDVHIALSNVCFEVWLLLHKQKTCAAYDSYDDLAHRSKLKKHFNGYNKADKLDLKDDEISSARLNAVRMNDSTRKGANSGDNAPSRLNPYTDMPYLLDAIDDFMAKMVR